MLLRSCPEVLCLLRSGTGCPVCSVRCRHSPNLAFPPTTRESAVLLRNRRQWTEPETIQNQRKRGRGADRIVGSSVCNPASPYTKTSCIAPGAFGEGSRFGDRGDLAGPIMGKVRYSVAGMRVRLGCITSSARLSEFISSGVVDNMGGVWP